MRSACRPRAGWRHVAGAACAAALLVPGPAAAQTCPGPCTRSSFAGAPRSYTVPNGPVSSAGADFDEDGRVDLAVATSNGFIRILRGVARDFAALNSYGPFSPPPRAIAATDLNLDGHADVVAVFGSSSVAGSVQVFLGDGHGALGPGVAQGAGTNTSALAIGDFDGNGAPDVAAAAEDSGDVRVFLGDAAGGLGAALVVASGLTTPSALVAADLTADGLADIAVAEHGVSGASAVHVLRASVDTGGALSFARITPTAGVAVGTSPDSIAAGDLDGDDQLDLVTADNGASRVSVVRRATGGGFLPAEPHTTGANPTAVALIELTGDGRLDIAVTTSATRTLTVLRNAGSGAFSTIGAYPVQRYPRSILPLDADGDGHPDLAVTCQLGNAVVVFLSRPPVLEAVSPMGVGTAPRAAVSADLDGDGDLDLAVANQSSSNVSLLLNDGSGGFTRSSVGTGAGPDSIVAADFNEDGRVDLALNAPLASTPGVSILLGPVFGPAQAIAVGSTPDALTVGDFNGDGHVDLAVCDRITAGRVWILPGNGSGGFTTPQSVAVGNQPTALVAADFDGDGDLDLAVGYEGDDLVRVLINSSGVFSVSQTLSLPGGDVNPFSIAAADFDGDGDADLAVAAWGGDRVHVFRNTAGALETTPILTLSVPYLLESVKAVDVNRDGRPDLVTTATAITVFRAQGAGLAFAPPEAVMAGWRPWASVVADLNGDAWPDVAVVNGDSNDVSLLISTPCQARRLEVASLTPPAAACGAAASYAMAAEVRAYDDGGNLATCASGTVAPSIVAGTGDPLAQLSGSTLPLTGGVASFADLAIDRPGWRYRLQFSLGSVPSAQTRSFTLGPQLRIEGVPSLCPSGSASTSTFTTGPTDDVYDAYAWTLSPAAVPPAYTPSVTLTNPPVSSGSYTLSLTARVDGCRLVATRQIYAGPLQFTTLAIAGYSTVCVDCIGGTVTPTDVGGGPVTSRQWGYRKTSGGTVVDIPGETGETYVLKGASFPGPGLYYVVVRTTPTCGTVGTVSAELAVNVVPDVPTGEVMLLGASSRGTTTNGGENRLQWVNTTASAAEVRIRWNRAAGPGVPCLPPAGIEAPADGEQSVTPPAPTPTVSSWLHEDDGTPPRLDLNTEYCYSVFVRVDATWSAGRTVKARPFDSAGPVKWAYSTGATAVVPPVVGHTGILVMSNDRTVHSVKRGGETGGYWPSGWVPYSLTGVAHSRSPVVPFGDTSPVFQGRSILFAADDVGDAHAVETADGLPAWSAPRSLGMPVVGAPGGLFTQYGGITDLIVVGTRDTPGPNVLRGLAVGSGLPVGSAYDEGGTIGPISGSPAIDYATQRVYFTSRRYGGGDTVWCVQVDGTTPFTRVWSSNLGDVDGSPVLRNGRLYFGNAAGVVYSLDAATGLDERTFVTGDGPVRGFVFPDRRNDDLIFATNTTVWSISDAGGGAMIENWRWTDSVNGLNPSVVLYWPQTNYVYVGSQNGRLYELDFTSAGLGTAPSDNVLILGDGRAQVGAPSLDIGVVPPDVNPDKKLLVVGSESGTLYGVEVPF